MSANRDTTAADNYLTLGERKQQFKLVRRYSYIGLAVILLLLLVLTWFRYSTTEPILYIPLPQLMFVMLLGALLLNLTSVVFGALEVYAASGGETRYLIARHGYSTGVVTAAFAAFFFVVIAALGPVIDDQIDFDNSIEIGVQSFQATVTAPFNVTSDYTGSSYLATVEVTSQNGMPFNITIYQHDDYSSFCQTDNRGKEILRAYEVVYFKVSFVDHEVTTTPAGSGSPTTTPAGNVTPEASRNWSRVAPYAEDQRYMIVLERREVERAVVNYHQNRQLDPGFVNSVYVLLIMLIALNAAAAVYNRIVRQKWRAYGEKNL